MQPYDPFVEWTAYMYRRSPDHLERWSYLLLLKYFLTVIAGHKEYRLRKEFVHHSNYKTNIISLSTKDLSQFSDCIPRSFEVLYEYLR
jgi:hypothetical protein